MRQWVHKSDVIGVNKEAYIYLQNIQRVQRGCQPWTPEQQDKMWRRCYKTKDGLKEIDDESLGGGDGTRNGRWWSWDVETIRGMLKDAGYNWVEYGTRESIEVSI